MSIDLRRLYYNALFGALGGLISWLLIGLFLNFETSNMSMLLLKDALLGATVGVWIGGALGMVDGLTIRRSLRRVVVGLLLGAFIGLVGGLVGLLIGEMIFGLTGGGVWSRAIGWALFGLLVGTGPGVAQRSMAKVGYGALGGLLGGLIGGATYEGLSTWLRQLTSDRDLALTVGSMAGLIILGACIGFLIGLVEDILRTAWVKVMVGRLEGRTLTISGRTIRVGGGDSCELVMPGDNQVLDHHLTIEQDADQFVLHPLGNLVLVNKKAIAEPYLLQGGERIQLGRTQFVFYLEQGGAA